MATQESNGARSVTSAPNGQGIITVTVEERNALISPICLFAMPAVENLFGLNHDDPDVAVFREARAKVEEWFALFDALDFGGTADVDTYRVPLTSDLRAHVAEWLDGAHDDERIAADEPQLHAMIAKIDAVTVEGSR